MARSTGCAFVGLLPQALSAINDRQIAAVELYLFRVNMVRVFLGYEMSVWLTASDSQLAMN